MKGKQFQGQVHARPQFDKYVVAFIFIQCNESKKTLNNNENKNRMSDFKNNLVFVFVGFIQKKRLKGRPCVEKTQV